MVTTKLTRFIAMATTVVIVSILIAPMLIEPEHYYDDDKIDEFPPEARKWWDEGAWVEVNGGRRVFYVHRKSLNGTPTNATIAIIHGFPTSSFDYHKVIPRLQQHHDVIVHDHIGYGFSDKPTSGYTYSLTEAAENTLAVWRALNVRPTHIVAHDMGDSVLCEILSRHHRRQLPPYFNFFADELASVTFTNGGMSYGRIDFRPSQTLLSNYYMGAYFQRLANMLGLPERMAPRQLARVFGPAHTDTHADVQAIIAINKHRGGVQMMDKLIYYLRERPHNEYRWYQAITNLSTTTTTKVNMVWGADDVVNPLSIAHFIAHQVAGGRARLRVVPGAGHFVMLEKPDAWLDAVTSLLLTS